MLGSSSPRHLARCLPLALASLALTAVVAAGCGSSPFRPDGATPPDGGRTGDAVPGPDGTAPDGQTPPDGAPPDSTPRPDGGPGPDTGPGPDSGPAPDGGLAGTWIWQSQVAVSPSETLNAVWASGSEDAWAVGDNGTALHWNGQSWSQVDSGTLNHLNGVWGSARDDVWAVGGGLSGTGPYSNLVHWNGRGWAPMDAGTTDNLYGVWGTGKDDVYAVGASGVEGVIVHFDGQSWTPALTLATNAPRAVHGSGPDDIWAVGGFLGATSDDTSILHKTTSSVTSWAPTSSGDGQQGKTSVWAASAGDAWAVGNGALLHWNGQSWGPFNDPLVDSLADLAGIWGSSATAVWAVGPAGAILGWDGALWNDFTQPGANLKAVGGSDAANVWAVGDAGTILRLDPTASGAPSCEQVGAQCVAISACSPGQGHISSSLSCPVGGGESVCCTSPDACGGSAEPQCCSDTSNTRFRPDCTGGTFICPAGSSPCPLPP
jgi:hypothetical protein